MSKILALDLSTKSTGVALFNADGALEKYECLTAYSEDLVKRICTIRDKIKAWLEDVDIVVMEEVRPANGTNVQTHRALMWMQAAVAFLVHDEGKKGVHIEYLYPNEWRSLVGIKTGKGIRREALKTEDIKYVKEKWNVDTKNDDIADAIGVGAGYILKNKKAW